MEGGDFTRTFFFCLCLRRLKRRCPFIWAKEYPSVSSCGRKVFAIHNIAINPDNSFAQGEFCHVCFHALAFRWDLDSCTSSAIPRDLLFFKPPAIQSSQHHSSLSPFDFTYCESSEWSLESILIVLVSRFISQIIAHGTLALQDLFRFFS